MEIRGGFAGVQRTVTVLGDGSWTADDLVRAKKCAGRYSSAELDSLRTAADALSTEAWGPFRSDVADDFEYRVSVRRDDIVMTMEGNGMALPDTWRPMLRILERPLSNLRP
jgi:hypothetical protein